MFRKTGKRLKSRMSRLLPRQTEEDHPPSTGDDRDTDYDCGPEGYSTPHLVADADRTYDGIPPTSDPDPNFRYNPLSDATSIRLLVLEPGQSDEPLYCSLQESSLDDCPPFEAISYVWGTPYRTYRISCEGQDLWITPNLRDALQRVRLPHEQRRLWADSICINQDDRKEQGSQVSLMGTIYSEAQGVLICLGLDRMGDGPLVISFIKEVDRMIGTKFSTIQLSPNSFPYPDENDPILIDERWTYVSTMVQQPWFSRGWVVQEAGLAKYATVLWGSVKCPWFMLIRALIWSEMRGGYLWDKATVSRLHQEAYKLRFIREATSLFPDRGGIVAARLPDQLHSARWLNFSDPRDRIYAFLELPSWAESGMAPMYPSYSIPYLDVYFEFAKNFISNTHDLTLLHYIQHDDKTILDPIPSWAPRWDINNNAILSEFVKDPVFLSQFSSTPPRVVYPGNILRVRGVVYDKVHFVSPPFTGWESIDDMAAAINMIVSSSQDEVQRYGRSYAAHVKSIVITLGQGVYPAGLEPSSRDMHERAYIHRLQRVGTLGNIDNEFEPEGSNEETLLDEGNPGNVGDPRLIHGHISRYCGGMRLFVTENGYYGMAQSIVQRGDYCSIVFDTKRPFLLRKEEPGTCFKILGTAWILGEDELCIGARGHREWLHNGAEEVDIDIC